jgi:hypothetical protein
MFTKTGSGQTEAKIKTRGRFCTELVEILRAEGIPSIVDGAHALGAKNAFFGATSY